MPEKQKHNSIPKLVSERTIIGKTHVDPVREVNYRFLHNFDEVYPYAHDHDFYEIFLVVKGKCYHIIDQRKILISRGQMVFIRPADVHKYERYNNEEFNAINLAFLEENLRTLQTYLDNNVGFEKLIQAPLPPLVSLGDEQLMRILYLLEQLHVTPHNNINLIKLRLKALLVEIFVHYFDKNAVQSITERPIWLEKLLLQMNQPANFTRGLSCLIELSCKSQEHVSRVFKEYLQMTPSAYVKELQLTYASNLLLHSNKHIDEIALISGFDNLSYFYRVFQKKFGLSPGKFRDENRIISASVSKTP